jgi:hypothetical protein
LVARYAKRRRVVVGYAKAQGRVALRRLALKITARSRRRRADEEFSAANFTLGEQVRELVAE